MKRNSRHEAKVKYKTQKKHENVFFYTRITQKTRNKHMLRKHNMKGNRSINQRTNTQNKRNKQAKKKTQTKTHQRKQKGNKHEQIQQRKQNT